MFLSFMTGSLVCHSPSSENPTALIRKLGTIRIIRVSANLMSQSDPNRVVRQIPLVVGGLCGTLLMVNRITTLDLTTTQSRSDALGIFMSTILILCGLLWQRIQPRTPDSVVLNGEAGIEIDSALPESIQMELAWASHSLIANTPVKTLVVYDRDGTLMRRGILGGSSEEVTLGTITERVLKTQKPVYLVDLKLYPGRVEFDYLPDNTQGLICQPLGATGLLIVGSNAPRSFTQKDEDWIAAIADKLAHCLSTMDGHSPQSALSEPFKMDSNRTTGVT